MKYISVEEAAKNGEFPHVVREDTALLEKSTAPF